MDTIKTMSDWKRELESYLWKSYTVEEIISIGIRIGITPREYNNSEELFPSQIVESFLDRVFQKNKTEELLKTLKKHKEFSRPAYLVERFKLNDIIESYYELNGEKNNIINDSDNNMNTSDRTSAYTVFLSSTRWDLDWQRKRAMDLMKKNGFRIRTIDDLSAEEVNAPDSVELEFEGCDAMLMILAGSYGTLDFEGVGYIEREYELAMKLGIPVECLFIRNITDLPYNMIQRDSVKLVKLLKFRESLMRKKDFHVHYYSDEDSFEYSLKEAVEALKMSLDKKQQIKTVVGRRGEIKARDLQPLFSGKENNRKPVQDDFDLDSFFSEIEKEKMNKDREEADADFLIGNITCDAQTQQYSFETLMGQVLRGNYYVPKYQRRFRWSVEQVQNLINSLIRGLPIPPIYVCQKDDGRFEILDGQQRIYSLLFYFLSVFPKSRKGQSTSVDLREISEQALLLSEMEQVYSRDLQVERTPFYRAAKQNDERETSPVTILSPQEYKMKWIQETEDGKIVNREMEITFDTMNARSKRRIMNSFLTITTIYPPKTMRSRTIYQIFKNLNSGGVQLSRQELRNGVYASHMYEMLFSENNDRNWQAFCGNNQDPEYEDMEFLLRLCALKYALSYDKENGYSNEPKSGCKLIYEDNYDRLIDNFSEIVMEWKEEVLPYQKELEKFFGRFKMEYTKKQYGGYQTLLETLFLIQDKEGITVDITDQLIQYIKSDELYRVAFWEKTASFAQMKNRLERGSELIKEFQRKEG